MHLLARTGHLLKNRFGFLVLIFLLTIISVATVKSGLNLMGWDNYSSYFAPGINLFRTLFATWRDYRGLGVPSDAEVTDVFRQLLFFFMRPFVTEQLLDQLYYLFALWAGVLGMYAFAGALWEGKRKDLFGFIAALVYLFNLNTLSVFYSPIIPFTNRFYGLPLLLYAFLRFLRAKKKLASFLLLAILVIVTSGSYITPTVIITSLGALFLFVAFQIGIYRAFVACGIYLALNFFWILPFANYVLQKSPIIPLARTFIEINESTLHTPPSSFSLVRQAILTPSFFDLRFRLLDGSDFPIHPLLGDYTKGLASYLLYLFPVLYGIGSLRMLMMWKANKRLLWIPLWIGLFLFLSTKEFGPLGWLYRFLAEHVPLFGVVFRIADTKFHAYISIAGSVAGAYAIMWFVSRWRMVIWRRTIAGAVILIFLPYLWLFRGYVTGNLIGFFAYASPPPAYQEIAATINATPGYGRVLHLPMDQWHSYWRSFSWGYVGSSFFHYLINKPYIDKTFEPASLENSYLHERINALTDSFYRSRNEDRRRRIASQFLTLLREAGIQYVMLDESISSSIPVRNMLYSAKQYYVQSKELIDFLASEKDPGLVRRATHETDIASLSGAYRTLYPVAGRKDNDSVAASARIDLFEVLGVKPVVRTIEVAQNIDPGIDDILGIVIDQEGGAVMTQDPVSPATLTPFRQQRHEIVREGDTLTIRYRNPNAGAAQYRIETPAAEIDAFMLDVYGSHANGILTVRFDERYLPDINGKKFTAPIGTVSFPWRSTEDARLMVNDVFLFLPDMPDNEEKYLGSVMLHEQEIRTALLQKHTTESFPITSFRATDPISCAGTPSTSYEGSAEEGDESLRLSVRNGSTCVRGIIVPSSIASGTPAYAEAEFQLVSTGATQAYLCLREGAVDECLNTPRVIRVSTGSSVYRIPLRRLLTGGTQYVLDIGVVDMSGETQTLDVRMAKLHLYTPSIEQRLAFHPENRQETMTISGSLDISFPKAASAYSYVHDRERSGFSFPLDSCRGGNPSPRIVRFEEDALVTRMENCSTHAAAWLTYAPDRPYLFAYSYRVDSGQQPSIVLGRDRDNYLFERASLWQGYPNLRGMIQASRLIDPLFFTDSAPADTAIHLFQDTANTGVMAISDFDMMEYPASWPGLTLTPVGAGKIYLVGPTEPAVTSVLPSLWRVQGNVRQGSMVLFNRGYDRQWGIYDSLWGALFGKPLASPVRCQGYAMCFTIDRPVSGPTYYIFYTPERLYFLGWLVTGTTVVLVLIFFRSRSPSS